MQARVKYHAGAAKIEQHGDWYDLATAEEVTLRKGDFKIIRLGVSIELPQGYEAIVAPRSSTFKKYGILQANGIGIIDNGYCGDDDEWGFPAYACRDVTIPAATRICQFRIQKVQPHLELVEVDSLDNESRGGFGSSGEEAKWTV